MTVKLIVIAALLFLIQILFLKLAKTYNIIDSPNHRSAHKTPTVRGGGIIVPIAIILYAVLYEIDDNSFWYLLSSVILVSTVSFVDDLIMLSSKVRLIFHLIAFSITFYSLEIISIMSFYDVLFLFVVSLFSIGFLNIYNFMDGINGITFLNALVTYLALLYLNINYYSFADSNLLVIFIIALLVFGFFNFRIKALCFAGDIGSISLGFSLIYFALKLYLASNNIAIFLIFSVYLLDGGWTIIERIIKRENIFEAHKRHLYQLAVNDLNKPHLKVSLIYFIIQQLINALLIVGISFSINSWIMSLFIFIICSIAYVLVKRKIIFHIKHQNEK